MGSLSQLAHRRKNDLSLTFQALLDSYWCNWVFILDLRLWLVFMSPRLLVMSMVTHPNTLSVVNSTNTAQHLRSYTWQVILGNIGRMGHDRHWIIANSDNIALKLTWVQLRCPTQLSLALDNLRRYKWVPVFIRSITMKFWISLIIQMIGYKILDLIPIIIGFLK